MQSLAQSLAHRRYSTNPGSSGPGAPTSPSSTRFQLVPYSPNNLEKMGVKPGTSADTCFPPASHSSNAEEAGREDEK